MPHGFNTMINAYAQAFNIGNAVMVLEDMVDAGVMPDRHTYGCLIKACQRCGESDLAFLVYRLMRNQVRMLSRVMHPLYPWHIVVVAIEVAVGLSIGGLNSL
jgi:pentatricopeptide repeat protein